MTCETVTTIDGSAQQIADIAACEAYFAMKDGIADRVEAIRELMLDDGRHLATGPDVTRRLYDLVGLAHQQCAEGNHAEMIDTLLHVAATCEAGAISLEAARLDAGCGNE